MARLTAKARLTGKGREQGTTLRALRWTPPVTGYKPVRTMAS
jgi:hypothetical protein